MEQYYNAGYYLIKQKPIGYGTDKGKIVGTCSKCINFSVFDDWCLSWMSDKLDDKKKHELELTDEKIEAIHTWTDNKFYNCSNVLPDLKTAIEFKSLFLTNLNDIGIYSLYFSETSANSLIDEFAEEKSVNEFNYYNGNFELRHNLVKKTEETDDENEELVGYDFIGVESNGSFHSFYCHNITKPLIDKFTLQLNSNGLFNQPERQEEVREYLNTPGAPVEPVPWYIVKVKRQKNANSYNSVSPEPFKLN